MKRMMKAALMTLMVAGLSPLGFAADVEKTKPQAPEQPSFDLSFSGGTPAQLIAAIHKAGGGKLNALVPPELADVRIPPMELRAVTASTLFNSLFMLDSSMRWVGGGNRPDAVWVLTRDDRRKTQVFYVGHLLKKFKVDDITTAVKTTWQMGGKAANAELKYHEDTQLLIARAEPSQINAMSEVVSQLQIAVEPSAMPVPAQANESKRSAK